MSRSAPLAGLAAALDVRAKLTLFVLATLILFLFSDPVVNLAAAVVFSFALPLAGLEIRRIRDVLIPLLPILVLIVLISGPTYPASNFTSEFARRVLFHLLPGEMVPVTVGGLLYGLTLALRIYAMVVLTALLTGTTPVDDFLQLLRKVRAPYGFAFMLATAMRFVPTMQRKAEMVMDAQRARGARIGSGGVISRIRSFVPVMVPLLGSSLRMSEDVAAAMLNRGYGASAERASLHEIRMASRDWLTVCLGLAGVGIAIALRLRGLGQL